MAETIRYSRLGREDLNLGTGTFEVRLADGRVVVLTQIDIGAILSDADLSSRNVTLETLTVETLTVTGAQEAAGTLQFPEKADPSTLLSGEIWINDGGTFPEYSGAEAAPTQHALVGDDTTQTLTNKTLTSPAITTPVVTGTQTGTYALGGTPSLAAALDASDEDITAIDELGFTNAAANPSATGRIRRSGDELLWRQTGGSMRIFYGESGTIMLFQQTTAPVGWTKITTHNDKALRVVSGAASSGGADAFSTIFNSGTTFTTNNHTLTTGEIPSHAHSGLGSIKVTDALGGNVAQGAGLANSSTAGGDTTETCFITTVAAGGGGAHSHTMTMDLQFVDLILASKT